MCSTVCSAARALRLKWPNDLMLADRKLGGILCEARWQGDRLRAGSRSASASTWPIRSPAVAATAIALVDRAGPISSRSRLIEPRGRRDPVARPSAPPRWPCGESPRLTARDWLRGRRLREPEAGLAEGIAPDGALWCAGRTGLRVGQVRPGGARQGRCGPRAHVPNRPSAHRFSDAPRPRRRQHRDHGRSVPGRRAHRRTGG